MWRSSGYRRSSGVLDAPRCVYRENRCESLGFDVVWVAQLGVNKTLFGTILDVGCEQAGCDMKCLGVGCYGVLDRLRIAAANRHHDGDPTACHRGEDEGVTPA